MKPDFSNDEAVVIHVAAYRHAVARLQSQNTDDGLAEWGIITAVMRQQWAEWRGEDNLHETAFG